MERRAKEARAKQETGQGRGTKKGMAFLRADGKGFGSIGAKKAAGATGFPVRPAMRAASRQRGQKLHPALSKPVAATGRATRNP